MTVDLRRGFGLEFVGRETLKILLDQLNTEIISVDNACVPEDEELSILMGVPYEPIATQQVETQNFYLGHKPSLIEAPPENYPNISVMTESAAPAAFEELDSMHTYALDLAVEILVNSVISEDQTYRRLLRTTEAVNNIVFMNRTLDDHVLEIGDTPHIQTSEVFKRKETRGTGLDWFWQGARIEYTVYKFASFF